MSGTGIGMGIVKVSVIVNDSSRILTNHCNWHFEQKIAQLHGGSVKLQSVEGVGTTISIVIPTTKGVFLSSSRRCLFLHHPCGSNLLPGVHEFASTADDDALSTSGSPKQGLGGVSVPVRRNRGGSEHPGFRVLVVDDVALVRKLTSSLLTKHGQSSCVPLRMHTHMHV